MILKRAHIKNFRALRDVEVEFGPHTAILGGNGAGKSTILRAIDRFYAPSTNIEIDDFFGRKVDDPIEIALTFTGFSEDEATRFGDRIEADEMTVTRVFEAGAGRSNGRYYGSTRQYPPFAEVRAIADGLERRRQLNVLAGELGFQGARNAAEVEERMRVWEAGNPGACEMRRDDGQFFGFTNVARGNLQKSTSFVFIPAVRDASADSTDARGAVIAQLMELVVRSAVQRRADVRTFQAQTTERYRELVDPERMPELDGLAGSLSTTLKDFYADAGVTLRWRPPADFSIPLPTADVLLEEDGFEGPVDRKGHGLQRAFIVTLLQHLAKAGSAEASANANEQEEEAKQADAPYVLPGLILAIEEPELYQHPTKQRHFASVLKKLSDGSLPGVAAQTQVIFASHSALFVSLDRFDEVRLARRHAGDGGEERECRLTQSSLAAIVQRLEAIHQVRAGTYSEQGLRSRLHIIGPELAEGFFADLVVLVEGVSDKAAIMAAASLSGIDFEACGIAVLNAEGKTKIDRPAAIFDELGIPTYCVFDCDGGAQKEVKKNMALQRLFGETEPFAAALKVAERYACFEHKVEQQLEADLTSAFFLDQVQVVQERYSITKDEVLKTPFAMADVLAAANAEGRRSEVLDSIVQAILNRRSD